MAESYPNPTPTGYSTPTPAPLTESEERTWAMLAHLTVLINLVTGFIGPIAALIIYLVYRDRSRYVAYHALQSLLLQLIVWVGGGLLVGAMWTVVGLLSAVIVGLCLIPVAVILTAIPLVAPVYGVIAAIQVNQGRDFKYYLIGDWVRGTLTGTPNM